MTYEQDYLPILERIRQEEAKRTDRTVPYVIAIDGRAASGKTTLAAFLAEELDAAVVHMDDFFLPPELRTEKRYALPGANVHGERFAEEVLPFIRKKGEFSYRRFDCHQLRYDTFIPVGDTAFRIVEGSYSEHPLFGRYADLTVFVTVSEEEQAARILRRNGEEMAAAFREKWIPLEEAYFSTFPVEENADLVLKTDC